MVIIPHYSLPICQKPHTRNVIYLPNRTCIPVFPHKDIYLNRLLKSKNICKLDNQSGIVHYVSLSYYANVRHSSLAVISKCLSIRTVFLLRPPRTICLFSTLKRQRSFYTAHQARFLFPVPPLCNISVVSSRHKAWMQRASCEAYLAPGVDAQCMQLERCAACMPN